MANSNITKRAIADAFRQLLDTTPFERITVTALALHCGINRQTFYYHFRDIYDLMGWIVEDRVGSILGTKEFGALEDAERLIEASLIGLRDEQTLVIRLVRSADSVIIKRILQEHLGSVIHNTLEQICQETKLTAESERLVTDFFVGGYLNTVYEWVINGMQEDPTSLAHHLAMVLCSGLHAVFPLLS